MCKHGDTTDLLLPCPDHSDPHGRAHKLTWTKIDSCIAPIVRALNSAGVVTRGSCCGHGKAAGGIALADGRWLVIMDRDAALSAQSPERCKACGGSGLPGNAERVAWSDSGMEGDPPAACGECGIWAGGGRDRA